MSMPVFSFWARTDRDTVAIVDPEHVTITVGALQDAANQVARNLQALGVAPGDTVAMLMRNRIEVYQVMLAIQQIGAYLAPINWHLAGPEVSYILTDSETKVLIADADLIDLAKDARPELCFTTSHAPGCRDFAELRTGSTDAPENRRAGMVMNYTSGTTGRPKGVRRPLPPGPPEPVVTGFAMFLLLFGMSPGAGVQIVGSPLYHTAVLYFSTSALHLGHSLVVMEKWTPEGMLERIDRYKVTSSHMVPTQFTRLLSVPNREQYNVSSLKHMVHGAAPCPAVVKQRMLEWWGDSVWEYYAATEGGGTAISPSEWRKKPGSVGKPWQGADIKIVDDEGQTCAPNVVGTVYIKMQQTFEYHKDKEKTGKAYRVDGYFTVGDAGYLDEEGYLYLSDRKSDMIISGGVNIYPAEIEGALIDHPAIMDIAVFGVPDEEWGEQVKAVVELRPGFVADAATTESILAYGRERLAKFKCPKSIDFVDLMPRDPNGKLAKRKLRDPYWADLGRAI